MKNKHLLFSFLAFVMAGCIMILTTSWIPKQNYTLPIEKNNLSKIVNPLKIAHADLTWLSKANGDNNKQKRNGSKGSESLNLTWSEMGPDNLSGRTRAILVDKNNSSILYIGGAGGGIWKSTTSGSSWIPINDIAPNLAVSCIAQGSDGAIYAGTGEGLSKCTGSANGSTAFIGGGIYKSTDGTSFNLLTSTIPITKNSDTAAWAFINKIVCDPTNANRVYASTNKGLMRSDDGGTSWENPVNVIANATDVDVSNDGTVVASIGNKCYISNNGNDNTFTCLSGSSAGQLPANGIGRLEMAIAPSNSNYLYASIVNPGGNLYNIYKSDDKGNTWVIIGPGGSSNFQPYATNGLYNNIIAVHPTDPKHIFVGGDNLWELKDSLSTWSQRTINSLAQTNILFLHSGQNTLVFDPTNSNIMYIGSNGGVSKSSDCGQSFITINRNCNTVQCNAISCSPVGKIMVGTKDNGTLFFDPLNHSNPFPKHATNIVGDNGGWSAFSCIDTAAYFTTTEYGLLERSPDGGKTFYSGIDGSSPFFDSKMYANTTGFLPGSSTYASYVTPLLLWENFNDTYAYDSISFTPEFIKNENIKQGDGIRVEYDSTFQRGGQSSAAIVPGSLEIICAGLYVTDDGTGKLIGDVDSTGVNSINYTTGVYKVKFKSPPAYGKSILASYKVQFFANSSIQIASGNYASGNQQGEFNYITPDQINYGDTIKVQDIIQSKFYFGTDSLIWMTKQALRFAIRPLWFKVASISGTGVQCMALSQDGNNLFVGTSNGLLYRVSNLLEAQDSLTADVASSSCVVSSKKLTFNAASNRAITSIAIDPSDASKIVVTLGGYGYSNYIYYCSNALDSVPTFTAKQGNLTNMPVYTSCIPLFNSGTVIIGTEHGIYSIDDITSSSINWNDENTGLADVPVYMISQQKNLFPIVQNYGTLFAATHGRGVFECSKYTSINEPNAQKNSSSNSINVNLYPNPLTDKATISFTLPKAGNVSINIYEISGKMIKSINTKFSAGEQTYSVNFDNMSNGTYFLQFIYNGKSTNKKFVVNK